MLAKRDLNALKKRLPKDGVKQIADLTGKSESNIRNILNDPSRYNLEVINAAIQVAEDFEQSMIEIKSKIKKSA